MDYWQPQQRQLLLLLLAALLAAGVAIETSGSTNASLSPELQSSSESDEEAESTRNLIDRLLLNYTRQNSPHGDQPTIVHLGIYINSFYSISEQTMDYSVNIYLRQQWYDPRLQFSKSEVAKNKDFVKLEDKIWDKLWVPDVFFRNEKKAEFHHVTIPNRMMNLYPNGKLWYAMKISATLSCMMELHKYPLDTQECPMMLESFGYTMQTVIFKWLDKNPVDQTDDLSMPQFILKNHTMNDCSQNYTTGSYPCLEIGFILQRDIMYFLIQVYIPTILIVILSWVAFWINTEAIPARVSLGLLTVLTMTTQSSGAGQSLPRVSYIKAIDVWMSVCLVFVFASLLEFAVVNVYSRRDIACNKQLRTADQNREFGTSLQHSVSNSDTGFAAPLLLSNQPESPPPGLGPVNKARKIDKMSRRLFPLTFLIFNVVYWVMYLVVK